MMEGDGFMACMGLDKVHTCSIDSHTAEVLLTDTWKGKTTESQIQVLHSKEDMAYQKKQLKRPNQ